MEQEIQIFCLDHQIKNSIFCITCFLQSNQQEIQNYVFCTNCKANGKHAKHRSNDFAECFKWFKLNIENLKQELQKCKQNIENLQKIYTQNLNTFEKSVKYQQHQKQTQNLNVDYAQQIKESINNLEILKNQNDPFSQNIPQVYNSLQDLHFLSQIYKQYDQQCNNFSCLPQDSNVLYLFAPCVAQFNTEFVPDIFQWNMEDLLPPSQAPLLSQENEQIQQKLTLQKQYYENMTKQTEKEWEDKERQLQDEIDQIFKQTNDEIQAIQQKNEKFEAQLENYKKTEQEKELQIKDLNEQIEALQKTIEEQKQIVNQVGQENPQGSNQQYFGEGFKPISDQNQQFQPQFQKQMGNCTFCSEKKKVWQLDQDCIVCDDCFINSFMRQKQQQDTQVKEMIQQLHESGSQISPNEIYELRCPNCQKQKDTQQIINHMNHINQNRTFSNQEQVM